MTDKKSSESRRKLLKTIAAGSGAVIAGKSLPEDWTKPIVNSVILPAHAQTSPSGPLAVASVTWVDPSENPEDEIFINIDNNGNYSLTTSNTGGNGDTIVQLDGDYDFPDWDYYINGANWPTYPSSWSGPSGPPSNTGENNLTPGTYTIESTRISNGGNSFRVAFTVSISPTTPDSGRTMTVSLDSVTPI